MEMTKRNLTATSASIALVLFIIIINDLRVGTLGLLLLSLFLTTVQDRMRFGNRNQNCRFISYSSHLSLFLYRRNTNNHEDK